MAKVSKRTLGKRRRRAAYTLLLLLVLIIFFIVKCSASLREIPTEETDVIIENTTEATNIETTGTEATQSTETTATTTEVTVTTDMNDLIANATELPTSAYLEVTPILQNPELPTGCEITSLTMALNYLGYDVDKLTMADDYLICADAYTATFGEAFIGSPYSSSSWGCYSPVILKTAQAFLEAQGGTETVVDLTGSSFDTLLAQVANGTPVITWVTIGLTSNVEEKYYWTTDDGDEAVFLTNEHCVLLCGYDLSTNTVQVCDPLEGLISYDRDTFENRYEIMYQQAVMLVDT